MNTNPTTGISVLRAENEALRAKVARVRALAAEHAQCSGCRTPWWLTAAMSEPDPSTQREHPCPGCDERDDAPNAS